MDTELTEFHGTDFFWVGKEGMEHCTGIHRRCAHGCATEGTERGSMADAASYQREYGDRKMRSLHGGIEGVLWVELRDFRGHGIFFKFAGALCFSELWKIDA